MHDRMSGPLRPKNSARFTTPAKPSRQHVRWLWRQLRKEGSTILIKRQASSEDATQRALSDARGWRDLERFLNEP
jgi:hypothetical protein